MSGIAQLVEPLEQADEAAWESEMCVKLYEDVEKVIRHPDDEFARGIAGNQLEVLKRIDDRLAFPGTVGRYPPTTLTRIPRISYGRTEYWFRVPVEFHYEGKDPEVSFVVACLRPLIGIGTNKYAAFERFCEEVHVTAQRLLSSPEANWTEEEFKKWELLSAHIDFNAFLKSLPAKAIQIGVVTSAWPREWRIRWTDGREEAVLLRDMPADFAVFEKGDWLETTVDRDPITKELLYVYSVRPTDPEEHMTPEEFEYFWKSLQPTEDLPKSNADWTQP